MIFLTRKPAPTQFPPVFSLMAGRKRGLSASLFPLPSGQSAVPRPRSILGSLSSGAVGRSPKSGGRREDRAFSHRRVILRESPASEKATNVDAYRNSGNRGGISRSDRRRLRSGQHDPVPGG